MQENCAKHIFEMAAGQCRMCHTGFCEECLVWSHGPKRPPLCIGCALAAGGVRRSAARQPRVAGMSGRVKIGIAATLTTAAAIYVLPAVSHLH
ncbi:MAG: hypothetical protein JWO37_375 [Acidimicrobiales bacterium]|jgi:hypothetical protein|nr:hypothetical protein [Acidimicrobiales bacterium]